VSRLPGFTTLFRAARTARATANWSYYSRISLARAALSFWKHREIRIGENHERDIAKLRVADSHMFR